MSLLDDWEASSSDPTHLNNPFADPDPVSPPQGNPFAETDEQPVVHQHQHTNLVVPEDPLQPPQTQHQPRFHLNHYDWKQSSLRSASRKSRSSISNDTQIAGVSVGKQVLAIGINGRGCGIVRWNLSGTDAEEFRLSTHVGETVHSTFMDPSGNHCIVSLSNGDNFYLHSQLAKPRGPIVKLKGIVVDSVAWNKSHDNNHQTTSSILLGTSTGAIIECCFEGGKEKFVKPVFSLRETIPICGLHMETFNVAGKGTQHFIMAATARRTRCYQFIGGPSLESVFAKYAAAPETMSFWELPGTLNQNQLHFFSKTRGERASSFSLLTEQGVFHGALQFDNTNAVRSSGSDHITTEKKMLFYPTETASGTPLKGPPVSMVETEFHYLLLYSSVLVMVSKLSEEIVHEEPFSDLVHAKLRGLVRDPTSNTVWVFSASQVYQAVIEREDVDVWRLFLKRADENHQQNFQLALQYCNTEQQRNAVVTAHAEMYFDKGQFKEAAVRYAETNRSFEQISLMFIDKGRKDALRTYLVKKLDNLPSDARTKRTILCCWLVELFLENLNLLREHHATLRSNPRLSQDTVAWKRVVDVVASQVSIEAQGQDTEWLVGKLGEEERNVKLELWNFLRDHQDSLEPVQQLVFNLMSSHGREEELLFYAKMIHDYERVINHYIQRKEYDRVVETLDEQTDAWINSRGEDLDAAPDIVRDLFYMYAPVLMEHVPSRTVDLLIKATFLDPPKLIPALVLYAQKTEEQQRKEALQARLAGIVETAQSGDDDAMLNRPLDQGPGAHTSSSQPVEAIRYLEHCVQHLGDQDESIHNFLLSLYASQAGGDNLIQLLEELDVTSYDPTYALRVCKENGQSFACVKIYSLLGLHDEAVEQALDVDVGLAKTHVQMVESEDLQKKLWLRIVQHEIAHGRSVKECIDTLKESDVLKIEDVLPFFPDFAVIDDFKDEICSSLEDYNQAIEQLKEEMQEYTENADLIRQDIKQLRNRFSQVSGSQQCDLCGEAVLAKDFYVFPCTHAFHSDCLLRELAKHVDDAQSHVMMTLRAVLQQRMQTDAVEDGVAKVGEAELAKLEEFVSAACPFCGDLMIQSIGEPFLLDKDTEEAKQWDL